ncbi:MAG TPA: transglutaminase domain-containing protein, partial [Butyricimonas virosa]|nr:transglutaminase domain-containing protein [Butyricimonas virosa]
MIMKQVLWILLAFVLLCACEEKHFMTDPDYRRMVEQDFQKKKEVLEGNPGNLFAVFDSPMSVEEREALMFLYAYSPLIDLSFSGGDFLLKHVRWAFQAREAMPWGKDIPEDIFRHFVLPVRGGKENLDTARIVFYKELKERVAACESMEKAAL